MPKHTLEEALGSKNNPFVLPEYIVYPYTINLETFKPFDKHNLIGHSKIILHTIDPELKSTYVDTRLKDKNYNLITNNCSDDTRKVLEAVFNKKVEPFLFTTPGDVRDFFIENGAIPKRKFSKTDEVHGMNVTKEQFKRGLKQAHDIRYIQGKDSRKYNIN